jgi:hypothetical protein
MLIEALFVVAYKSGPIYETELKNLLQLLEWCGECAEGEKQWGKCKQCTIQVWLELLLWIPPYNEYILIKIL